MTDGRQLIGDDASKGTRRSPREFVLCWAKKWLWPMFYLFTVLALIWWYEIRPARQAMARIQGTWQLIDGVFPDEMPQQSYVHIDGSETWLTYPLGEDWRVQRSRIWLEPAKNVFLVHRAHGFDYGTTRETEYLLHLRGEELSLLRGLARLDPMMQQRIDRHRKLGTLPEEAQAGIQSYLERMEQDR